MTIKYANAYRQSDTYSGPFGNLKAQVLSINLQKDDLVVGEQLILQIMPAAAVFLAIAIRSPGLAGFSFDLGFQVVTQPDVAAIDSLGAALDMATVAHDLVTGKTVQVADLLSVDEDANVFMVLTPTALPALPRPDQTIEIITQAIIDRP